jgi:hypothetical protein
LSFTVFSSKKIKARMHLAFSVFTTYVSI